MTGPMETGGVDLSGLVGGGRSDERGDFPVAERDSDQRSAERESSVPDHLYALSSQPPLIL